MASVSESALEFSYGYMASVNGEMEERPVVQEGCMDPTWFATVDKAKEAMNNDLRFSTETFIIAKPKANWFRWTENA